MAFWSLVLFLHVLKVEKEIFVRGVAYLHTTLKNIWSHYFTITLEKTNSLEKGYNEDGLFQNILLRLFKNNFKISQCAKESEFKEWLQFLPRRHSWSSFCRKWVWTNCPLWGVTRTPLKAMSKEKANLCMQFRQECLKIKEQNGDIYCKKIWLI